MAKPFTDDGSVSLKFGGGVHSRASEDDIDVSECKEGANFKLDLQNTEYRPRDPFDLIGTAPNGGEIRGFACLLKTDGSVSTLVQAAGNVYEIDSNYNFTQVGTVSSTAQLRGRLEHNWQLTDKVLITDLNLQQPVMEWDGTTLQNVSFTDEADSSFGTFNAKYCLVSGERANFSNVRSNGTATPNLMVGSKIEDYTQITVANQPASALGDDDPFYIPSPDNRPFNGLVASVNETVFSTDKGSIFKLNGSTAKDFSISKFYVGSAASGEESLVYAGNDVLYGRQGRLESVNRTDTSGDVETDNVSIDIEDQIIGYKDWLSVYNSRTQNIYFFPSEQSECWVLYKPLIDTNISPWIKYTTSHEFAFMPTAAMNMYDPLDGLEYVFMGDSSGNVYRMEGTGSGDSGSTDVASERLSALISAPLDGSIYEIEGFVKHRKDEAATLTLTFEYAGESVFSEAITINLPAATGAVYYNDSNYYSDGKYYGTPFKGKLRREKFAVAGSSNEFQVRATVEGTTNFEINEILLRFKVSSP